MSIDRFPGAPPSSYVCEEGWLIIRDQAWTEAEWRNRHRRLRRAGQIGRPVRYDDERHRLDRERKRLARQRRQAVA